MQLEGAFIELSLNNSQTMAIPLNKLKAKIPCEASQAQDKSQVPNSKRIHKMQSSSLIFQFRKIFIMMLGSSSNKIRTSMGRRSNEKDLSKIITANLLPSIRSINLNLLVDSKVNPPLESISCFEPNKEEAAETSTHFSS